ncbi:uncharacterized protein TNCV_5088211 [Trichonephila clavipes]|nr:uncharacterized protein TNCV_5088211 [Trichonephila clavipes]
MPEKGNNHLLPGLDYMVDALKLPNQAPRVSDESLQTCVAWRCPDGTQHIFCWPILSLDWYQIFGSTLVQNTATDFAQLKAALSKAFPAIQNKKDLETRFYASQQRQNQEPTDFVYDLLKLHKKLELGMSEKALVDHIFVRLEPQVQDYVEVRNPQTAIQLLEVLAKFEERYSCKATLG